MKTNAAVRGLGAGLKGHDLHYRAGSRRSPRGFTLIEMVIVICLVGILASILFSRVLLYQELAEKAAMQQVVSALQTALVLEYGHSMANSTGSELNQLTAENPMDWLVQKPDNYAGEFHTVNSSAVKPGNWAFEQSTRELIYVPDHAEHFVSSGKGDKLIRYRARLAYDADNRARGAQMLAGVIFSPVEPYQWLIRERQ